MLNKIDLLSDNELADFLARVKIELPQYEHVYAVSTVARLGLKPLSGSIMSCLEAIWLQEQEDPDALLKEQATQTAMQVEGRNSIAELAERRAAEKLHSSSEFSDDDDEHDVEIEYIKD